MRKLAVARSSLNRFQQLVFVLLVAGFIVGVYVQTIALAGYVPWPGGTATSISVGDSHSCAVASGKAYCWGSGTSGRLGNGSSTNSSTPVAVSTSGVMANKTVTQISAGESHTCAVADGQAFCWGLRTDGRLGDGQTTGSSDTPVQVGGLLAGKTVTNISATINFTCAVASGKAYCWGFGSNGELGNGGNSSSSTPVAVNESADLGSKTVTQVSSGDSHSCVIAIGRAYCWGLGGDGRLGRNSFTTSTVPVAVSTSAGDMGTKTVTDITASELHSCAVADAQVFCWGNNTEGRLGNGSTTRSRVPAAVTATAGVLGGKTVTDISSYGNFTCATASGQPYCWGFGGNGQLGDGTLNSSTVPVAVAASGVLSGTNATAVSSGDSHSCVIAGGQVYCWGLGAGGRLGHNAITDSNVPVRVIGTVPFVGGAYRLFSSSSSLQPGTPLAATNQPASVAVATGANPELIASRLTHSCSAVDGKAYCWGNGLFGKLGNGSGSDSATPVAVDTSGVLANKNVTAMSTGSHYTCAIASGQAYCWGDNYYGNLGNNSTLGTSVPVAVDTSGVLSGKTVTGISAGSSHTCAIASGQAYCWGSNDSGQLGNNDTSSTPVPVAVDTSGVLSNKTVTAIAAGDYYTCAIASGQAYCWGNGFLGQLGDGSGSDSATPVAVDTSGVLSGKTVTGMSAGSSHTCAIASGQAYCWGLNSSGQLGNNSTSGTSVPVAVDTSGVLSGKTVTGMSAGNNHTCAIASGQAYCWGSNGNSQLGNNSTSNSSVPVAVSTSGLLSGKTVTKIAAGIRHSCVVASGAAYCWGEGIDGRLGQGSMSSSTSAVEVRLGDNIPIDLATTFRMRLGLGAAASTVPASSNNYSLQFAKLTAASCSAQSTGFSNVTGTSEIRWYAQPGLSSGSSITSFADDPVSSGSSNPQRYLHAGSSFTNAVVIDSGKQGLWDFSLRNTSQTPGDIYCLRMAYSNGTPLEQYSNYPQVNIGSTAPTLEFVDSSGDPIAAPSFAMSNRLISADCQTSTTTIGSSGGTRLRASQGGSSSGWSVSIAPADGQTAAWSTTGNTDRYDFNDPSGTPAGCNSGSDGDGLAGQMTLALGTTNVAPQSGCSTTGLSWAGSSTAFSSTVGAITLMSASSSSQSSCYWDIYDTQLSQTIPPMQPQGSYEIDLTATVVAN